MTTETLGPEDSAALAAALLNPPAPTEKLKAALAAARPDPRPRNMPLPLGGQALMYTRENLTQLYRCGHGELGRLLARRMAPLPIRFDGQILWFVDECLRDQAQAMRTLERWRKR